MRLRGGVAKSAEHAPVSWLRPHMSKQWNAQKSEAQNANVFYILLRIIFCIIEYVTNKRTLNQRENSISSSRLTELQNKLIVAN